MDKLISGAHLVISKITFKLSELGKDEKIFFLEPKPFHYVQ